MTKTELFDHFIWADSFQWYKLDIYNFTNYFKIDIETINEESESFHNLISDFESKYSAVSCMDYFEATELCKILQKYIKLLLKVRRNKEICSQDLKKCK